MPLRFDGRVAIVTGAGNGLGKEYALLLSRLGAKVVVNDLGGSATGEGSEARVAQLVVDEIKAKGGVAVPDFNSVVDGDKIVDTAMKAFGRVDILINNAGILRDGSFQKMTDAQWNLIYQVHLKGTMSVTKAAWPIMREQRYGRIIMVTSAAGIYGNFGQANYSSAKMGIYGLANTLALEGSRRNIFVNTVAPIAGSRLTATVLPEEMVEALKPQYVAPIVAWLCHEECEENGGLFEMGGGWIGRLRRERTKGGYLVGELTPESVRKAWKDINDFKDADFPETNQDALGPMIDAVSKGVPVPKAKL